MPQYKLTNVLLNKLRELPESSKETVAGHEAFVLFAGLGDPLYLRVDGRFFVGDMLDEKQPVDASNDQAIAAIVIGAENTGIVELLTLLPPRPPTANDCVVCKGERFAAPIRAEQVGQFTDEALSKLPRILCIECGGIGWTQKRD